jgi:GR25 family glycosyltransferase involved in LPS biosynthesis
MRIAIGCPFQFSFFSHGSGQTILAITDALKANGFDITIVSTTQALWWDDVKNLKETYKVVLLDSVKEPTFDLFIDVDGTLNPEKRKMVSTKSVIMLRKPPIMFDIEPTIYPIGVGKRDYTGVSAVWLWDHFEQSDIDYIHLLSGLPVVRIPYVWTPTAVDAHKKETNYPEWQQTITMIKDVKTWDCHVCETNFSCSTSSTIPVVMLSHAKKHTDFPVGVCNIHSADHIKENEFFKKNIMEHCQVDGLSYQFTGRQRCVDWTVHCKGWVLSHLRFLPIRSYLLDLVWSGIPVVHNSIWLRDMHPALAELYYPDNSLTLGTAAMHKMIANFEAKTGYFAENSVPLLRKAIIDWITPRFVNSAWSTAVQIAVNGSVASACPVTSTSVSADAVVASAASVAVVASAAAAVVTSPKTKDTSVVRICFTDMWDDFNPTYNFFTLLLQESVKNISPKITIEGYTKATLGNHTANLIIFGPFGEEWKTMEGPKVFFTGENTKPIDHADVKLNLTFENTSGPDDKKMRLPLWFMEIDWFGANISKLANPKPLPLDDCCKVNKEMISKKKKFCAFVVTNPCNPVRNDAFKWLSMYKDIDSAGRLFNNVGDVIFAGRGGGGGELKKHEFLKQYKFCLSYENASASGYTTEKILHAKAAGCIPIYWGDPEIGRDFDVKGFLNAQSCTTPEDLINLVKKVDENDEVYDQMTKMPALDPYRRDLIRRRFSEISRKILLAATGNDYSKEIPRFLGATTNEEAKGLAFARGEKTDIASPIKDVVVTKNILDSVVVATYASKNFFEPLHQWLTGYKKHSEVITNLRAHVFLNNDISDASIVYLKEHFSFATFEYVPTDSPADFPDLWDPQHFAWKIWCYRKLASLATYKDCLIWYTDAGSIQVRWPIEYLEYAKKHGVCVLEDKEQFNYQWCHQKSQDIMKITPDELADKQIVGGLMAFVGMDPRAISFYEEAWKFAQIRDCIVGPKWGGVRPDGKPFGHRHDQSIMGILSLRHRFPRYPLEKVYGDKSLRKTFKNGGAVYVHRGNFSMHNNFTDRISDAYVINLDRRADRYSKFLTNNKDWGAFVERMAACEGKDLQMTGSLARLLAPNDFLWKKAIAGCAMSHLKLWFDLANEQPFIENYLIMEDDARFEEGWISSIWKNAVDKIPADYDVLYLGGVLPPNRPAFYGLLETVNESWARVSPNQIFGQKEPTRYFHFCNYAYILRRESAIKLIKSIVDSGGYTTSADHMICNKISMFNHYVLTPQVAGCYQDDDPKYQNSQFNNFNRVDAFDSDLWNNDERFSEDEVKTALAEGANLDVGAVLKSVFPVAKAEVRIMDVVNINTPKKRCMYSIKGCEPNMAGVLERRWLSELFADKIDMRIETVELDAEPLDSCPIFFVQRPHTDKYVSYFQRYENLKKPFAVLHLSDEYANDSIEFYKYEMCKYVIRNYARTDINNEKVLTIPLGYNKHSEARIDVPYVETPSLPFRTLVWSFYGTGWNGREESLAPLKPLQPSRSKFFKDWLDSAQLPEIEYVSETLNSIFVPCPAGMNAETFRVYEALENGAIPLIVRVPGDDAYIEMLKKHIFLLNIPSWNHAAMLVSNLVNDKQMLELYRNQVLSQWANYKLVLKQKVAAIIDELEKA